jgi:hypothetical protein
MLSAIKAASRIVLVSAVLAGTFVTGAVVHRVSSSVPSASIVSLATTHALHTNINASQTHHPSSSESHESASRSRAAKPIGVVDTGVGDGDTHTAGMLPLVIVLRHAADADIDRVIDAANADRVALAPAATMPATAVITQHTRARQQSEAISLHSAHLRRR